MQRAWVADYMYMCSDWYSTLRPHASERKKLPLSLSLCMLGATGRRNQAGRSAYGSTRHRGLTDQGQLHSLRRKCLSASAATHAVTRRRRGLFGPFFHVTQTGRRKAPDCFSHSMHAVRGPAGFPNSCMSRGRQACLARVTRAAQRARVSASRPRCRR